jgi:hypothetical protein
MAYLSIGALYTYRIYYIIPCGHGGRAVARKPIKLQLRLDEPLRRRLERLAARNERSMNAEIIHRLEESIRNELTAAKMSEIIARLDKLAALTERDEEK